MQITKNELKNQNQKQERLSEGATHSSGSIATSKAVISQGSENLSKNLAGSLMRLIDEVNKEGVTPETVNASCNAAAQIYKILRLNYEMKKEGM